MVLRTIKRLSDSRGTSFVSSAACTLLPILAIGAGYWMVQKWDLAPSKAIALALAVAALTLALFAVLGNVTEWKRAARSTSAALCLGAACLLLSPWLISSSEKEAAAGTAAASASAPGAATAGGGAFDISNAIAAVLAVVLAVTTLIATKTATDARDEIRRLMDALQQERERDVERWAVVAQLASLRTVALTRRAELDRQDSLIPPSIQLAASIRARNDVFKSLDAVFDALELVADPTSDFEQLQLRLGAAEIMLASNDSSEIRKLLRECGASRLPDLMHMALGRLPAYQAGTAASAEQLCTSLRRNGLIIRRMSASA